MTSAATSLTIYPDYCHILSPTIGRWCPLRATDVFALRDVGMFCDERKLYHHGNHPVKWVRLTGVIVAVDEYAGRSVYTLDDSSGMCIECAAAAPAPAAKLASGPAFASNSNGKEQANAPDHGTAAGTGKSTPSVLAPQIPWDDMDVGVVVKVKGKVGEFRDVKKIEVVKIEVLRSTDMEVRCWNEVLAFRREVLHVPWAVSEEEEEKCRMAREKELRRARRKKVGNEESTEERRRRKEKERLELGQAERREKDVGMLPPPKPKRKIKYPPLAVIKAAAGKYDALGI